jgi:hypothetical protein
MNSKEPRLVRGLGVDNLFQPQGFNPGAASSVTPVPPRGRHDDSGSGFNPAANPLEPRVRFCAGWW